MAHLRDEDGNFYEVSADEVKKLKKVEPPVAGDYFPASDYRWDPRDGSDGGSGDAPGVRPYHWQPPAYHWNPTDYHWNPPKPSGGAAR
jgi:hypothetical protein